MTYIVNDLRGQSARPSCGWTMTVLELAIYIAVHRSPQPLGPEALTAMLEDWFEQAIEPDDVAAVTSLMVGRGWLLALDNGLWAAELGRQTTRPLMNGVIRMLDHGTRLLDVALMMSVLRLTKGELDNARV